MRHSTLIGSWSGAYAYRHVTISLTATAEERAANVIALGA